jgi:hypothetical protein
MIPQKDPVYFIDHVGPCGLFFVMKHIATIVITKLLVCSSAQGFITTQAGGIGIHEVRFVQIYEAGGSLFCLFKHLKTGINA